MTKEDFKNSFISIKGKSSYPYSCITLQDLYNIIYSYKDDIMNFCIEDVCSWRGIYEQPCCIVTNNEASKEHNLDMVLSLLEGTFHGYKDGEFTYNISSLVHFEIQESEASTLPEYCYWYRFLNDNENNPFIQHMYKYFEEDKYLNNEYYQDYFGNDLKEGEKCIYWTEDGFAEGLVFNIDKNHKLVWVSQKRDYEYETNQKYMECLEFDKVIQLNII